MAKVKTIVRYSPSNSDFIHMAHCIKTGVIKLAIERVRDFSDEFYLVKTDDRKTPVKVEYFLKDFSKPPIPSNKQIFKEYDAYEKMFKIYKEFYMRNNNIKEEVIMEDIKKEEEKSIPEPKQEIKKETKTPDPKPSNREIDLFELIEMCENEEKQKNGSE